MSTIRIKPACTTQRVSRLPLASGAAKETTTEQGGLISWPVFIFDLFC